MPPQKNRNPNKTRNKKTGRSKTSIILAIMIAVLIWWSRGEKNEFPVKVTNSSSQKVTLAEGTYLVERCVDGDTLLLTNNVRIRLIGADTPETVKPNTPVQPFGTEASNWTKKAIANNQNQVMIHFDGTQVDQYGRTLAMVWAGDIFLNEELIRQGLARAQTQYKYSQEMKNRFLQAENDAKSAKRGIWSITP